MSDRTALLPPGFRDRLPPAAEVGFQLMRQVVDTLGSHGYARVAPPMAEYESGLGKWLGKPLTAGLFRSPDPATGAALVLRPDITGQVARIAATRMADASRPLRLSYAGTVLRGSAPQLAPERELTQAGAELIGADSEAALAELITMAIEALAGVGVDSISIDLTTPGLVRKLAAGPWPVADIDTLLDILDSKDLGALTGPGQQPYRALLNLTGEAETALPRLQDIAPELTGRLRSLIALLPAGVRVTIDPTERHGFEYHSWLGFSLFGKVGGQSLRDEIGRGGAYHVRHPDSRTEPGCGVSLYIDPLVDAGLGTSAPRRVFLPLGTGSHVGARLRAEGWITVAALSATDSPLGCSHVWNGTEPAVLV